jgi:hypothetical protein
MLPLPELESSVEDDDGPGLVMALAIAAGFATMILLACVAFGGADVLLNYWFA